MSQIRISDDGELEEVGPVTWDGEPLYCADTVREGLFDPAAFTQMRGQMNFDATDGDDGAQAD